MATATNKQTKKATVKKQESPKPQTTEHEVTQDPVSESRYHYRGYQMVNRLDGIEVLKDERGLVYVTSFREATEWIDKLETEA